MDKLKYTLAHFMQGRYGTDQLYKALNAIVIALLIINLFAHSTFVYVLFWIVFALAYFRVFSKNINKRQHENNQFLSFSYAFKKKFSLPIRRIKEIRNYRFRKCPHCKQVLRVKRKTGKHSVVCPKCSNKVTVRIFI